MSSTGSKYDSRLNATTDVLSLDLDFDLDQVNWAELPRSLLESPTTPLEWNDFTLEDDMLSTHRRRHHHGKRGQRGRGDRRNSSVRKPHEASNAERVSGSGRTDPAAKAGEISSQRRSRRSMEQLQEEDISNDIGKDVKTHTGSSLTPSSSFPSTLLENLENKDNNGGISDFKRALPLSIKQGEDGLSMSIMKTDNDVGDIENRPSTDLLLVSDALHFQPSRNDIGSKSASTSRRQDYFLFPALKSN
ncbi:hypothetical protein EGW08_020693 [Elysia chlorotica]|uniref:Uncharacterized protein n=1 Tax=Elysia chlorotica TaxID=188477 RepID=A0A433SQN3_ELYCH|nr:hypothetical protein EGW08_020693 [Elysia chlorotica]